MAVSATEGGLRPVSQAYIYLREHIAYLDYDFAEDDEYAAQFRAALASHDIIVSHHHGYYALRTSTSILATWLPDLHLQAGHPRELFHVSGNEDVRVGDGNRGDHEVVPAVDPSFPVKLSPHDSMDKALPPLLRSVCATLCPMAPPSLVGHVHLGGT